MKNLKKPEKHIIITNYRTFDEFDWACKKVSLDYFLKWCKKIIPPNSQDVCIALDENWEYDSCLTSLMLSWKEKVVNPHYEKDLKKYQKALKKEKAK